MNLYLISQGINNGYGTYDSAVVAAEDEDSARKTYPAINDFVYTYHDDSWWWIWPGHTNEEQREKSGYCWVQNADQVDVEYLGKAANGIEAGPICSSFNAG
jgi:hypothetical protein